MRSEGTIARALACLMLTTLLGIAGCADVRKTAPVAHEPAPVEAADEPVADRDPVLDLLEYAHRLHEASPEVRAEAVAHARDEVRASPGAMSYAHLALAFGAPGQTRYTPDEAARYAQLALNAKDAAWSDAAHRYLSDFARLYGELTQARMSRSDASVSASAGPRTASAMDESAQVRALQQQLDEAHRKLRELADIEDRLEHRTPLMTAGGRILLVDDDPSLRRLLALRLEGAGHRVESAESGPAALRLLEDFAADCVITDLRMDGMNGIDLLERLAREHPTLPVILLTAHGTIPEAVTATQRGALDFLSKPVDKDTLLARVDQALGQAGVASGEWHEVWRSRIVTRSPRMHRLLEEARLVADTDTSVLITGESGTGKEVLARALHDASPRAKHPFVAINCGAMPEQLLESELFGHERGAFTDAKQAQQGLFRSAEGGTVFLDEIGDMPLALQVKLLRVLQEREVRPVGAARSLPVNVRVISATHRRLSEAIEQQHFREDLYYRLAVVTLTLPGLRERPEDVAPLARHFLEAIARRNGRRARVYSPNAMETLCRHDWPGNIRQLSNVVEQNVALTRGHVISAEAVEKALASQGARNEATNAVKPLAEARDAFVRDYLIQLLRIADGNVARSARLARRNRTEFYKLLNRHAIDPTEYKG